MKENCLKNFTCLNQDRYGDSQDCTLTSITAIINFYTSGKYTIKDIYDNVVIIAKRYGYEGNKGTNPLYIKKIYDEVLHKYVNSIARSKSRYLKYIGFTFDSVCSLIDKGIPVIMSLWRAGIYKNHTITIIGYNKEKRYLIIADNWGVRSKTLEWGKISIISSINWY